MHQPDGGTEAALIVRLSRTAKLCGRFGEEKAWSSVRAASPSVPAAPASCEQEMMLVRISCIVDPASSARLFG
eukprot:scaffold1090_cov265-Pinguiococcus_pyrenoidosus.AAC.36